MAKPKAKVDGTWVEVSLYSDHPQSLFDISETRTQQILKELST